jgi:hypothetical protein
VVGEVKMRVSERSPARSIPASAGGALNPASSIFSETSVLVLPTTSTVKRIGICVEGLSEVKKWASLEDAIEYLRRISDHISSHGAKLYIEITRDPAFYSPSFVEEVSSLVDGVVFVNFFTSPDGKVRDIFEEDLHKIYVWKDVDKFSIESTCGDAEKATQAFIWGRRTNVLVAFVDPKHPTAFVVYLPKYRVLKLLFRGNS